ncbi:hypothetical protein ACFSYD_12360 [Paracoccus aerius]
MSPSGRKPPPGRQRAFADGLAGDPGPRPRDGTACCTVRRGRAGRLGGGTSAGAYLEGLDYAQLGRRHGLSADEARHGLHEELEHLSGHAADEGVSFAAAEQALGLRPSSGGVDAAQVAEWQERLARLANELTPVMAPARARQRIREQLGHGAAPLSVDPLERRPWWRRPMGIIAILLVAVAAWYVWLR